MSITELPGTASDEVLEILQTGDGDIRLLFASLARRHPDGADADYLRWHSLDHRPEQHRLSELRASLRVVSTPTCRAARLVSTAQFDEVDHLMLYGFSHATGMQGFIDLSTALRNSGRTPFVLPPVHRGLFQVDHRQASARIKAGADVLPWLPVQGLYVLLEQSPTPAPLLEVPGVAGCWSSEATAGDFTSVEPGLRMTLYYLDDDPIAVSERLREPLLQRWQQQAIQPLLAAPFYALVPNQWDRYLP